VLTVVVEELVSLAQATATATAAAAASKAEVRKAAIATAMALGRAVVAVCVQRIHFCTADRLAGTLLSMNSNAVFLSSAQLIIA
jgi:hypothetical protein